MDVERIARLARVALSPEEISKFSKDMKEVLNMFRVLDDVDVSDTPITMHPVEVVNIVRPDKAGKSLSKAEIFSNEKNEEDGYFKGPKTLE
ncbi:MAG: Asp-tRNA(Asn)/Glu-tRNA(Gln) amidotransferase subunit GatC [Candidatus Nanohaloarchaeota archaeon]|nr:Asp-tRNA(Asn)/Glu-tRNA(Gln) amidotransferase subunit GatC [Candidatus Nanohaloarchaeota archaeon]